MTTNTHPHVSWHEENDRQDNRVTTQTEFTVSESVIRRPFTPLLLREWDHQLGGTSSCSHTALGNGERGNDLLRAHNGTGVVWDIDVEGDMHHLVRVIRHRILNA